MNDRRTGLNCNKNRNGLPMPDSARSATYPQDIHNPAIGSADVNVWAQENQAEPADRKRWVGSFGRYITEGARAADLPRKLTA
jgi:hypothetical protein